MNVTINTTQYEFAYGRKPRGFGNWYFKIGKIERSYTGMYSQVCKNAKADAKADQVSTVKLMS